MKKNTGISVEIYFCGKNEDSFLGLMSREVRPAKMLKYERWSVVSWPSLPPSLLSAICFGCRLRESSPWRLQALGRESEWRTTALSIRRESSLVKILVDASRRGGFERAGSANKRTVANGFDGFPICNFPRRARKKRKERKRYEKEPREAFPRIYPASDLTNEAIARGLSNASLSLSCFDVSSVVKLQMKENKKSDE